MTDKQFKESILPILDCIDRIRKHLEKIGIPTLSYAQWAANHLENLLY